MAEVTDINGVGPAKADTLADEGYDSVETIAEADKDELAAVDGVGDDRALEFIVQAQDLTEDTEEAEPEDEGDEFDLTPAEVSDELEEVEEEVEEEDDEALEELDEELEKVEEEIEEEDDGPAVYDVFVEFDTDFHFDVFHAAVMRRHETVYRGNQHAADAMQHVLDGLDAYTDVTYELTEEELNELHSAVSQQRVNYQGENLIDHMDTIKELEKQINDQRREHLF